MSDTIVSLSFYPAEFICCAIKQHSQTNKYALIGFERIPLDYDEYYEGKLCNIGFIQQSIKGFLKKNKIANTSGAVVSLTGDFIQEEIIDIPRATPDLTDFKISSQYQVAWDYYYLYPKDDGLFVFYLVSIPQPLLLQYHLLAKMINLKCLSLTTSMMAHSTVYQFVWGTSFRNSQFALDMQRYENRIMEHFSFEMLCRIMHIDQTMIHPQHDTHQVLTGFGLYLIGKKICESY